MMVTAIILWLGVGQVAHLVGTYLACRLFGYRAEQIGFGFGPKLFQLEFAGTLIKVQLIPLLAYVKIAGMNPLEPSDPGDRGSFANGGVASRSATVLAGPLGMLLAGLCLFFVSALLDHEGEGGAVQVVEARGAASELVKPGDLVLGADGQRVVSVSALAQQLVTQTDGRLTFRVERGRFSDVRVPFTPGKEPEFGVSFARVAPPERATLLAAPARTFGLMGRGVKTVGASASVAWKTRTWSWFSQLLRSNGDPFGQAAQWAGAMVIFMAAYNMLPIPSVAGGRLAFLAYEATTRKRLDEKWEARLAAVGAGISFVLLLAFTVGAFVRFSSAEASNDAAEYVRQRVADFELATETFQSWGARDPRLSL